MSGSAPEHGGAPPPRVPPPRAPWPALGPGGLPLVLGHRGVRGPLPENTLPAFERAADDGADGIELDVRSCAGGEAVALHDPTLARVTGGRDRRRVAQLAYADLRRVDLGAGARVPLLEDVIALADARQLAVNVELKRDGASPAAVVGAAVRALRRRPARTPLIVSSFHPVLLSAFALAMPDVPRALLIHAGSFAPFAFAVAPALGARAVHIERSLATPETLSRVLCSGLLVSVWTVNDTADAAWLAARGVSSIITDVPGDVRRALLASGQIFRAR